jgi:histidyl-tRNA synthetase
MKHANNRNIPYVILLGEQELANESFVVKDMEKGDQKTYSWADIGTFANLL